MGSAPIKRIVTRRAHCDETVEIAWTFNNGEVYHERHTCPPKAVREARDRPTMDSSLPDATGYSEDRGTGSI